MDTTQFQMLTTNRIAELVQDKGLQVCGFTFNGTRRWFKLEYPTQKDSLHDYIAAFSRRVVEICQMLFEHGFSTLVLPVISPHVLKKRDAVYNQVATQALKLLVSDRMFLEFYDEYGVDVHLYGDYGAYLDGETAVSLSQMQTTLSQASNNNKRRIFWGICAHDSADTIAALTVQHFQEHGQVPTRDDLVRRYYGANIPPLDLYIGSSKPQAIDMPLISTGRESLYFTVAPSPYFNQEQLRHILFDHIYNRSERQDHVSLGQQNEATLRQFYLANQHSTLGVGHRSHEWDMWHPLPQVQLPQIPHAQKLPEMQILPSKKSELLRKLWHNSLLSGFLTLDKQMVAGKG